MAKGEFVWVSVGGERPEPGELITKDGREGVLTIGCPDPFWLDEKSNGVRIAKMTLLRPHDIDMETPNEREERKARYAAYINSPAYRPHSWRGPR